MHILLIEGEHKIANAVKRGLDQETYTLDVVYDGDAGLVAALSTDYDLIVVDRVLPGASDGVAICTELRQHAIHTPILMLTSKSQAADHIEGLNAGADDYLVKPFAFEAFLSKVKALLPQSPDNAPAVLKVADLTLDTQTYVAARAHKPINLSRKEFAILEYLMRNKDRLLSKENIITHVWNFDADVLPNTVEVYIGYLRGKIDRSFKEKPPLIQTHRGFGYKIQTPLQVSRRASK